MRPKLNDAKTSAIKPIVTAAARNAGLHVYTIQLASGTTTNKNQSPPKMITGSRLKAAGCMPTMTAQPFNLHKLDSSAHRRPNLIHQKRLLHSSERGNARKISQLHARITDQPFLD